MDNEEVELQHPVQAIAILRSSQTAAKSIDYDWLPNKVVKLSKNLMILPGRTGAFHLTG